MYDYIKGELVSKNYPYIVVECASIGYSILTNRRNIMALPELGNSVKIYTKLIHKEDSMTLCGFHQKEDRVIFDILTSVSGVGVKMGLALLDEFTSAELIGAVISEDYKLISRAKGIGQKLAQKIILELKDKLTKTEINAEIIQAKSENAVVSKETLKEVQTILISLGYTQKETDFALENTQDKVSIDDTQELLREALSLLSNG
ncbi:Holliday junction branch migration protein RuvA [bacterium]|nr:Holliday junction branch migration protein RuvA [bacterium]